MPATIFGRGAADEKRIGELGPMVSSAYLVLISARAVPVKVRTRYSVRVL